jgi:hypothetical protein
MRHARVVERRVRLLRPPVRRKHKGEREQERLYDHQQMMPVTAQPSYPPDVSIRERIVFQALD